MKKNDLEVSSPIPLENGIHITNGPWCTLMQQLFSMHSPCIFVQLPPRSLGATNLENTLALAHRMEVSIHSVRKASVAWRTFSMKGWQMISAARWRHELILPIFQVLALKITRPKGNKRRERHPYQWVWIRCRPYFDHTKHNRQSHHQTQPTWFATS